MMNHSSVKPFSAPVLVVTISSPDPTIEAEMISPGPSWRSSPVKVVGAFLIGEASMGLNRPIRG